MGSQQQYCLRWNNHQTNLLSVFDQLLQNESFVDVTLACGGLSLKAHKVVLSACSPYFQRLLLDNPCQHPIVILNHVGYDDLKALVDFMYKGEVNVQQDQLQALLKVAELLMIKGLSEVSPAPAVTINSVGDPEQPTGTVRTASAAGMTSPARRKRGRPRRSEDGGAAGTSISVVACGRVTMDDVDGMNDSHPGQLDVSVEELPSLSDDGGGATDGLMLAKVEAVDSESERSVARSHEGFNTDSEDVRSSNLESPSFLGMTGFSPSSLQSYNTTIPSGIMQQESDAAPAGSGANVAQRLGKSGVSVTVVAAAASPSRTAAGENDDSGNRRQQPNSSTQPHHFQHWTRNNLASTTDTSQVGMSSPPAYVTADPWQAATNKIDDGGGMDETTSSRRDVATNWTEEDLHSALEAVRSGRLSVTRAALTFGIPSATMWQRSRREGLESASAAPTRGSHHHHQQGGWSEGSLTQALDAVRGGRMSVNRASATYGIPGTTLWSRARRHGIDTGRRGGGGGWEQQEGRDETMWHALQAVKNGAVSMTQASIRFNVPYTTLWKHFKKWEMTGSLALPTPSSVTAGAAHHHHHNPLPVSSAATSPGHTATVSTSSAAPPQQLHPSVTDVLAHHLGGSLHPALGGGQPLGHHHQIHALHHQHQPGHGGGQVHPHAGRQHVTDNLTHADGTGSVTAMNT